MLEEVIEDLKIFSEQHIYNDIQITFYPSFILPNFSSFWLLESILGIDFLKAYISNNVLTVSQEVLEKIFDTSELKFYLNNTNTRIYSENGFGASQIL